MRRSTKDYFSDKVSDVVGSWTFVISQLIFCSSWILLNSILDKPFDPFPYSILSSMIQIEGALAASFIMISSNRQAEKDSMNLKKDLNIAEHMKKEIDEIKNKLNIDK